MVGVIEEGMVTKTEMGQGEGRGTSLFKFLSLAVAFGEQLTISCRAHQAPQQTATILKNSTLSRQ